MRRAAYALINLAHLKHNLAATRDVAKQSKIMAVVKADAYGHGMLQVSQALSDADAFSVAYINEAMELRESGIQKPLLALQGIRSEEDLKNSIEQNIQIVVHHHEQIKILKTLKSPELNIFLKIDTGMHRLGFDVAEVHTVLEHLQDAISPACKISLMTHLACADELDNPATSKQLQVFNEIANDYNFEQSIANSAGVLAWKESHRDWVRPGLMLYGINPIKSKAKVGDVKLKAVMSLHAPLISIKKCKKGEKIGYGGDFCCPSDMLIGIIAIGYADGYPRHLKSAPNVSIGTKQAPVLGRVSMDMIAVDLTGIETQVGDIVELWGETISVADVAKHAETISYELLCSAGNALTKKYIQ